MKVTLTATNSAGSMKSTKTILIKPGDAASFVYSPTTPGPGQTIQFADTSPGDPSFWQWDFGDGTGSTFKNPSHLYMKGGTYAVALISGNSSGSRRTSKDITIGSMSVCSSSFSHSPTSPAAGQVVQFTDTSVGTPTSWQWDFGDGTTSTAQNPSRTFTTAGSYDIALTVTNGSGQSSASQVVTVTAVNTLIASFSYSPSSPQAGQAVPFTDTSTGSPSIWKWDFGDGATSNEQNPSHIFGSSGSHAVILTVSNASGQDSLTKNIQVSPASGTMIYSASPELADVKAAINEASPGDTVVIPAGSATWESTLSYSKAIHLKGAGVGRTVITHTGTGISVKGEEGAQWTISGLEMVTPNGSNCILALGSCKNFRITDCKFHNPGSTRTVVVLTFGTWNDGAKHQYGVVDNCEFIDGRILVYAGTGEGSWQEPTNLGSEQAIFVEDCLFKRPNLNTGNVIDANNGGRYVFRHNYVEDAFIMTHSLSNGWENHFARGTRLVEIYGNTFKAVRSEYLHYVAMFIRSGTGVIYDNQVTNAEGVRPFSYAVGIDNVRTYETKGGKLGRADGSNPIDGNKESNGYPALDQIGRGQDAGPMGDFVPRYEAKNRTPQALEPMYVWNNTLGGIVQEVRILNGCEIHIRKNRDYYTTPKPGYTPYSYPHPLRER